jgi:hypothetical protein
VEDMPSFALSKTSEFVSILEMYHKAQLKHPLGTVFLKIYLA